MNDGLDILRDGVGNFEDTGDGPPRWDGAARAEKRKPNAPGAQECGQAPRPPAPRPPPGEARRRPPRGAA